MVGALASPKGITNDSNKLKRVRNAVRYSYPSLTLISLNAVIMSTLKKYFIPFKLFKVSLIRGSG